MLLDSRAFRSVSLSSICRQGFFSALAVIFCFLALTAAARAGFL